MSREPVVAVAPALPEHRYAQAGDHRRLRRGRPARRHRPARCSTGCTRPPACRTATSRCRSSRLPGAGRLRRRQRRLHRGRHRARRPGGRRRAGRGRPEPRRRRPAWSRRRSPASRRRAWTRGWCRVLGLRPDVRRMPIFGLGCVAGAAGIARVHDYCAATRTASPSCSSVELCSLTVQRDDASMANLVAQRAVRRRRRGRGDGGGAAGRARSASPRPAGRRRPAAGSTPTPSG